MVTGGRGRGLPVSTVDEPCVRVFGYERLVHASKCCSPLVLLDHHGKGIARSGCVTTTWLPEHAGVDRSRNQRGARRRVARERSGPARV